MKVLLERLDTKDTKNEYTLDIDEGDDLELGRGPLIRIDATNISRKKALLSVRKDVLYIRCLKDPAVILDHDSTSGEQEKVAVSSGDVPVLNGDVLKFDQHHFFYKITYKALSCSIPTSSTASTQDKDVNNVCNPIPTSSTASTHEKNVNNVCSPIPTSSTASTNAKDLNNPLSKNECVNNEEKKPVSRKRLSDEPVNVLENKERKKARKLPGWMLDLVQEDNALRNTAQASPRGNIKVSGKGSTKVSVRDSAKKGSIKESATKDKENVDEEILNAPKREPKDTKGKIKKSPPKIKPEVFDNESKSGDTRNEEKKEIEPQQSKEKIAGFIPTTRLADPIVTKDDAVQTTNSSVNLITESTQTATGSNIECQEDAEKTLEASKGTSIMDQKIGDLIEDSSLKIESEPEGMVYPVLIDPSELQDSDEETPKKKKKAKEPQALGKLQRPLVPAQVQKAPGRPKCPYKENCYRKNPVHFQQESHPGDDDYIEEDLNASGPDDDDDDDRPECEYGVDCYRKNPQHKKDFKHTHKAQPKRKVKQKKKKNRGSEDDEYESDFIDDDDSSEYEEDIDDTDEDENWTPPQSDED